jgi:hypothetical protein
MIETLTRIFTKRKIQDKEDCAQISRLLHLKPSFYDLQKGDWIVYSGCKRANMTPGKKYKIIRTFDLGFMQAENIDVFDDWGRSNNEDAQFFDIVLPANGD